MLRMRSRLLERFPPAGRRPENSKIDLIDRERLTAAAGRGRVRVLDGEAAASDRLDEIHLGAVQVTDADRVDVQLDAVGLVDLIAGTLAVFLDHQAILKPGAAAALHEHAQPAAAL